MYSLGVIPSNCLVQLKTVVRIGISHCIIHLNTDVMSYHMYIHYHKSISSQSVSVPVQSVGARNDTVNTGIVIVSHSHIYSYV